MSELDHSLLNSHAPYSITWIVLIYRGRFGSDRCLAR
jgi:hypothetical protein